MLVQFSISKYELSDNVLKEFCHRGHCEAIAHIQVSVDRWHYIVLTEF